MDSIAKIAIEDFDKKPDGSWVAVKNSDIITQGGGFIRIGPGMRFAPGRHLWGLDVAETLDKISLN